MSRFTPTAAAAIALILIGGLTATAVSTASAQEHPAAPAAAPATNGAGSLVDVNSGRTSVNWQDKPILDAIQFIQQQFKVNIVADPSVDASAKVTLKMDNAQWKDVLDRVVEFTGCVAKEVSPELIIVSRPPRVTIELRGSDLVEAINLLATSAGANVIIASDVTGKVTLSLNNVPWREALEAVVKTAGFAIIEEEHHILRIVKREVLQQQMETRMFTLKYVRPPSIYKGSIKTHDTEGTISVGKPTATATNPIKDFTLLDILKSALSKDAKGATVGKIDYDSGTNTIIITDTKPTLDKVGTMIKRLDTEPRQVQVSVQYVSTTNNLLKEIGLDIVRISGTPNLFGTTAAGPFGTEGPAGADTGILGTGAGAIGAVDATKKFLLSQLPFGLGPKNNAGSQNNAHEATNNGAGNDRDFTSTYAAQAILRAFRGDAQTHIVQQPTMTIENNNTGTIFVGNRISYVKSTSSSVSGTSGTVSTTINVDTLETGFQLFLIPHLVEGTRTIDMEVIPKNSNLQAIPVVVTGSGDTVQLPNLRDSVIVTRMMLEDGHMVLMGGMVNRFDQTIEKRIPGLSDIPLIGNLFRVKSMSNTDEVAFFFITPRIVENAVQTRENLVKVLDARHPGAGEEFEGMRSTATPEGLQRQMEERRKAEAEEFERIKSGDNK